MLRPGGSTIAETAANGLRMAGFYTLRERPQALELELALIVPEGLWQATSPDPTASRIPYLLRTTLRLDGRERHLTIDGVGGPAHVHLRRIRPPLALIGALS